MNVLFEPIWPWPFVLLVSAAMLATVLWTYIRGPGSMTVVEDESRRGKPGRPPRWRWLVTLRLLAWGLLTFAMFRPAVEFSKDDDRPAALVIAADASRSLGTRDGPQQITRREHLLKVLKEAEPEFKGLPKKTEVLLADFNRDLRPVKEFKPEAPGEQTALGYVLDSTGSLLRGKRVLSVILMSDGAFRALPPYDLDPRVAARKLADAEIRVDTVPFGTTALAEAARDLIAEDLVVSPTVFVKNRVVVSAKVRAFGAAGRDMTVRLLIEDPHTGKPGEPLKMKLAAPVQKLRATQPAQVLPVEFSFIAEDPGERKLTFEIVPLEGEQQVANNQLTTYISVLRGGIRVAYFDTVRPEQKWIRRVDESPDIQLDFQEIRRIPAGAVTRIDPAWFTPGKYDVYLIGDVPASVFQNNLLTKLAGLVADGAGLMMLGGYHSFGPGGYGATDLADLLPVRMRGSETLAGGAVDPAQHFPADQPLPMLPHASGLQHFVMRLESPERNAATWRQLPPLQGANRFSLPLKDLAVILAESPQGDPLLASLEVGRGRTMAFAGDTTYLWPQAGFLEQHQRFWQQCILWLAHKDVQGDSSIWVKLDNRRFRPGQPVDFTFGARDPDKRPIADAEFKIQIVGPKDQKFQVPPQKAGSDHFSKFTDTARPGEYRIVVDAGYQSKSLGVPAEARFVVYDQDLELHNPAADPALLQEISRLTGGTHVPPDQFRQHLKNLHRDLLAQSSRQVSLVTLWDNWELLLLFVLVLTAEWTLRKKAGMV